MPDTIGLFLGLTGLDLNAEDALRVHLADVFIPVNQKEKLWEGLKNLPGTARRATIFGSLSFSGRFPGHMKIKDRNPAWRLTFLLSVIWALWIPWKRFTPLMQTHTDDDWLKKRLDSLREGCPTTACLVWRQTHQLQGLPLKEVFRQELIMAIQCTRHPDFREGAGAAN
ncbi:MAG: enoyl-CoA hydratase/isomerase family protein [Desulfobacterales bacterium]